MKTRPINNVANGSTSWGSWKSPSNPVLRDSHEYIIVASKGDYGLQTKGETGLHVLHETIFCCFACSQVLLGKAIEKAFREKVK